MDLEASQSQVVVQLSDSSPDVYRLHVRAITLAFVCGHDYIPKEGASQCDIHKRLVYYSEIPCSMPIFRLQSDLSFQKDGYQFVAQSANWKGSFFPDMDVLRFVDGLPPLRWVSKKNKGLLPESFYIEWHLGKTLLWHVLQPVPYLNFDLASLIFAYTFVD